MGISYNASVGVHRFWGGERCADVDDGGADRARPLPMPLVVFSAVSRRIRPPAQGLLLLPGHTPLHFLHRGLSTWTLLTLLTLSAHDPVAEQREHHCMMQAFDPSPNQTHHPVRNACFCKLLPHVWCHNNLLPIYAGKLETWAAPRS